MPAVRRAQQRLPSAPRRERRPASSGAPPERALLVIDWWEKLAGASVALTAIIRLCQRSGFSLAAPMVQSSMFLPVGDGRAETWPLSEYYNTALIGEVMAPQRLVSFSEWRALASGGAGERALVIVVYADFPPACTGAMPSERSDAAPPCPQACIDRAARWLSAAPRITADWPRVCVSARALRRAIQGGAAAGGAGSDGLLRALRRYSALAMLNFRRHDDGRPMLPTREALALRAAHVQPAASIRSAARRFLRGLGGDLDAHGPPPSARLGGYSAVQLRSNHLAHSAFARGGGANCSRSIRSCVRRLSRLSRRLGSRDATVVATDLATLFKQHQDGESHRRKPYMRQCLAPSLPALHRWRGAAGASYNCTPEPAGARSAGGRRRRSAAAACDPGWLGLVDLVLASEASNFSAVDVREPWPSAFLEWIVQLRALKGRESHLIRC